MPEVHEEVINVKLADILRRELGIDARAERIHGRKRLDIRCYYKGLIIGIEASYSASDAEKDAEGRIEQGLVDIALALWIKHQYKDVPEDKLYEEVRNSTFDVKVFVPRDIVNTLIPFIEERTGRRAESATGWFRDVDLPTLKMIIEYSVEFLVREEEVGELLSNIRDNVRNFITTLEDLDTNNNIRRRIYDILYRLYGLSVANAEDPEVAFGHAALSILLSATFYEHVRVRHPELKPLLDYVKDYGPIEGLRMAFEGLLKIDYRTAVETALNIVSTLPPNAGQRVRDLINLGVRLASSSSLLRKDFAGRIYHEITGDIALRKGFATFYTEVPAAYLLASLAVQSLLGLDDKGIRELSEGEVREVVSRIATVKIGDLASGSGTLLTASYSALMRIATMLKYYYGLDDVDVGDLGRRLIEEGIYGVDALKYASQITAINLALIGPAISRENVYTIYLGYITEKNQAWLGSLELLNNGKRVGGLLAWIEGGLKGSVENVNVEGVEGAFSIPERFDLIIMNPPFTRATGRTERFSERRGLFGFIVDESIRQKFINVYEQVRGRVRDELCRIARENSKAFPTLIQDIINGAEESSQYYLNIGQAGEGLLFLYLAYKYIKDNGVIAFVLPKGLLAGISWFLARILLLTKFHLKYIIISNDPKNGYNFSEGTSLSEVLIIAKRVNRYGGNEETIFINLLRKPSTALEAIMLADSIRRAIEKGEPYISTYGGAAAIVTKIRREELIGNVDNWNRLVAFPDDKLNEAIINMLEDGKLLKIGALAIKIPITKLGNVVDVVGLAVRRGTFHEVFKQITFRAPDAVPALISGDEAYRRSILVRPNSWVIVVKPEYANTASKFLVPDRVWVDTTHATALYSEVPIVANMFFGLRPRSSSIKEDHLKVLILWFNTTWGLLSILSERTETRGRWIELTKTKWRLMPVIDITSLDSSTIGRFIKVFEKYVDRQLSRIPEQFNPENPDPARLGIDIDFLNAIDPTLDSSSMKNSLLELYRHVYNALRLWVGKQ